MVINGTVSAGKLIVREVQNSNLCFLRKFVIAFFVLFFNEPKT